MNRVINTTWLSNRPSPRAAATQAFPPISTSGRGLSIDAAVVRDLVAFIPSWVILAMVLLATLAICSTVIARTRAKLETSSLQYNQMNAEIASLRKDNIALAGEIQRMTKDAATIESAARERLGMVRPNDIVVPIESGEQASNLGRVSFVRK